MADPADESIRGRVVEILAIHKACRSEREIKAALAIWQAAQKDQLADFKYIADLSNGWDEDGSTGPRSPLSWETVARIALDIARANLVRPPTDGPHDATGGAAK